MSKHSEVVNEKKFTFGCDKCSITVKATVLPETWTEFVFTESRQLRLMEKKSAFRYDSYHIDKQKERQFCSVLCARDFLRVSVDIFLVELRPIKRPTKIKPLK